MTISSDLTLSGTPKDPGSYLVSVSIESAGTQRSQQHTAIQNLQRQTLADQMKKENFKDYGNGLYAWDIMEPWAISKFGSNVNGEERRPCASVFGSMVRFPRERNLRISGV